MEKTVKRSLNFQHADVKFPQGVIDVFSTRVIGLIKLSKKTYRYRVENKA